MILNAFSVLAVFAAALRVAIGLLVLCVGVGAWRRWRLIRGGEERFYLLFTMAATLVGLAVVSWPLLYLVLQSYVPEWPGVMCIQGVTRIGTGSVGAASYLPGLVAFLETAKPALVFVAGAWLVLHLAGRRERTDVLATRVLGALLLCGLVAVLDGAGELAYLLIPKQEKFLAAGCCSFGSDAVASVATDPLAYGVLRSDESTAPLTIAFFSVGVALLGTLSLALRGLRRRAGGGGWLALSVAGAAVLMVLGVAFLGTVAAPAFLRLPYHRCAYCLVSSAPESVVGVVLFVAGAFAVGWAGVARWLGAAAGSDLSVRLLSIARFSCLASLLLVGVRMVIP